MIGVFGKVTGKLDPSHYRSDYRTMDHDDKIRTPIGVAVSLRDMGNGTSRLFMDDIKSEQTVLPITWKHEYFYTFTPEIDNASLSDISLSDESLKKIGAALVARLVALNSTKNESDAYKSLKPTLDCVLPSLPLRSPTVKRGLARR